MGNLSSKRLESEKGNLVDVKKKVNKSKRITKAKSVEEIKKGEDEKETEDMYDYNMDLYEKDNKTGIIIDLRMKVLNDVFGPDIPFIIMMYLNAIYSIISQSFMIEIYYNKYYRSLSPISTYGCSCKICFNRNDNILAMNNASNHRKIPFECIVEITFKSHPKSEPILENYQCTATVSIIYVDKNTKLNLEFTKDAFENNDIVLMKCIRIKLSKPELNALTNLKNISKDEFLEHLWMTEYVFESIALQEYLRTHQEYGPICYNKKDRFFNVTFTDCPPTFVAQRSQ